MTIRDKPVFFASLLALAGASLFLLTGLIKLQDTAGFGKVLLSHQVFPESIAHWLAWSVPLAEIAIALWAVLAIVLGGKPLAGSLAILAIVFLIFAAYAIRLQLHPPRFPSPCGCMGDRQAPAVWGWIIIRNTLCALAASVGLLVLVRNGGRIMHAP